jgi:uncharacterized MAPEG superfamily protein
MTIAEWCLFGAVILYLVTLAPAKALAPDKFNNSKPRDPAFYAEPVRNRMLGAHVNGIETFPFFAAAVLLAEFRGAPQQWIDGLAVAFLVTRILFVLAYVGDRPTLRTTFWNSAFAFNVGIFFLAGFGERGAMIATVLGLTFAIVVAMILVGGERARRPKA